MNPTNATTTEEPTPSSGPAPRPLTDEEASHLLGQQRFAVLASLRSSGHPHMSTVVYHWDPDQRLLRIPSTAGRVKTRQLRCDPHTALHAQGPDVWSFAVAEGQAEVSPATTVPGDAVGNELLAIMEPDLTNPAAQTDVLTTMVAEQRVVIRIRVSRLYGTSLEAGAG